MEGFCGSQFWDWNTTWNTSDPDFTPCFENTVILAIPCLFLWLSSIFEMYKFSMSSKSKQIPWSWVNISKIIVVVILIVAEVGYSILGALALSFKGSVIRPVYYYSQIFKISSLTLSLYLQMAQRTSGLHTSGTQFLFWLLLSIYEAVVLRTAAKTVESPLLFVLAVSCSVLVFLELFLNFFSDSWSALNNQRGHAAMKNVKLIDFPNKQTQHDSSEDGTKIFPDLKSSFPSQLVFSWVGRLIWRGYWKTLEFSDLWSLHPCDRAENLIVDYEKYSRRESGNPAPTGIYKNIIKPLFALFGLEFLWATVFETFSIFLSFGLPQILSLLIDFIEEGDDSFVWSGYFYAILMAVVAFSKSILYQRHMYLKQRIESFLKSVLSFAVYRKALKVSNAARKEKTTGEIVNLLSVDVVKVMNFVTFLNEFWDSPLQIGAAIYFLYMELGVAVFAGVAVLVILIPTNVIVTRMMQKFQTKQMKEKDVRVKLMNEIISGMKILKLYAWEPSFEEKVKGIRNKEIYILKKKAILISIVEFVWSCAPVVVAVTTFVTYVLLGNELNAKKTFVSLALFDLLNEPATNLPSTLSKSVELYVSLRRLNNFMNAEELDPTEIEHDPEEDDSIVIENADFCWDLEKTTLKDVNLRVRQGSLVAVVGMVGCGKSSLLSALLGEMKKLRGRVNVNGKIAYVSQQPWIQNNTLQDNIFFGHSPNLLKYNRILESCALLPDLEILPEGDLTEIGEKGINLSGGQKQRVALARAVYSNADLYLFDDPLSAVDSHVGKHIFEKLLGPSGFLKNKTRVLVTHGLTYLPQVDQIIVLTDGKISECGTYRELLNKKGAFSDFLMTYVTENKEVSDETILEDLSKVCGNESILRQRLSSTKIDLTEETTIVKTSNIAENKLIEEEKAEVDNIKFPVLVNYMKAMKWTACVAIILMYIFYQGFSIGANIWLSVWTSSVNGTAGEDETTRSTYLSVYGAFGLSQCIMYFFIVLVLNLSTLAAARKLHHGMLSRILRAPLSFFETTPLGRIVNRFSSDIQSIDTDLPGNLLETLDSMFQVLAVLFVISWSTPLFLILVAIIAVVFTLIQRYYITTARQLFRINSITKSPVFSHLTETLHGVSTIRAYGAQDRFIQESATKIDNSSNTTLHLLLCRRWLGFRLDLLGCVVIFFAALFSVMGRNSITASIVGLSLSYSFRVSQVLSWFIMMSAWLETNFVSVERICEYTNTVQESDWENKNRKPKDDWPDKGVIQFDKYETRYRENLDPVLRNVTCRIEAGEKVGIVGRTGAGKSSMTLALFRIIEATGGQIMIDEENILDLGLHDIRGRITIIPQDPVLFSGSVRFNLDPFSNCDDDSLWKALELAHLKVFVQSLAEGLEYEVTEGGDNLSIGQRQLVCLARAILRKSKILVLDEATASIDLETDDLIQETIRQEFSSCTVLTIAHRINTIMDSSRVMVLDNGEIREFDSPEKLLSNKSSLFHQFAKDAGLANDGSLLL